MTNKPFYAAMIAGTHSSVGKTTWMLALLALARQKGLTVQPFKGGPDYIDPSYHNEVCAPRRARNLDLYLLTPETVKMTFGRNAVDADLALVEGMMGLFDGKGLSGEASSAQLAKLLGLPVFLVVDGAGLATSAAAIVLGFQKFDPDLKLAGVFFNHVKSDGHFKWLKQAVETKTGVPCLGYLPPDDSLKIPERHLGLQTAIESGDGLEKAQKAAGLLEGRFDWNGFCKASVFARPEKSAPANTVKNGFSPRIAVAYDRAFSFYYEDNFDLLREAGAELVFFSPLKDKVLPENIQLVYLGGGFPELYAGDLAKNGAMAQAIRHFHQSGGFIYAECGGLIYLVQAGLLPGTIRMTDRLQNFGYHELETLADTFLFPAAKKLKSHEFHYSVWEHSGNVQAAYQVGGREDGFTSERLVASYQHLHFGSDLSLVTRLIDFLSAVESKR